MDKDELKQKYVEDLRNKSTVTNWTEEETTQLIDYWNNQGKSSGEIGTILGKTPKSVVSKIKRLRMRGVSLAYQTRWGIRKERAVDKDKEYRKCLKCRNSFLSEHKLNRLCGKCTLTNAGVHDASILRVLNPRFSNR